MLVADGEHDCVYAVRLADGRLSWRFRAAAQQRKTIARDRIESVWPVHGSVLAEIRLDAPPVFNGLAAASGRVYVSTSDGKVVCLGSK